VRREDFSIRRVPATRCLNPECNRPLDAIGRMDDQPASPKPGDPIACLRCGNVMTIDADGSLRPFTAQEARELMDDPEAMRELCNVVGKIHAINVMVN
jgi:hypothetical protein